MTIDPPTESETSEEHTPTTHTNAGQDVIAVDNDDTPQGLVDRVEAHTGEGTRHRAFTCMVFDTHNRILLAQRASQKRLWDTHWDGPIAGSCNASALTGGTGGRLLTV